jgi:hypothetical protein
VGELLSPSPVLALLWQAEKKKSEVQVVKDKANDEAAVIDTEKQVSGVL